MSLYNCILKMLNLKDDNIIFEENFYTEEIIKDVRSQVYLAKLTYQPTHCYSCGHVFDENFEKHGFKTSTITLPKVSNMNAYLRLKKQRYKCHHCNSTFTLKTSVVDRNCYISNNTKLSIALSAADKISECDIAKNNNVSHSTVNRIINSYYEDHRPNYNYLPKNLCFDEFKSVKSAKGAMSFIFCDAETGDIIDILEDRRLNVLIDYFNRYTKKARESVKTVVIDMYKPYILLIKKVFPNAKIIMDKFHIIQLISRSLNKTRVSVMNKNKDNYNKFKRYWKLFLKDNYELNKVEFKKFICFKESMREVDVVEYLLDQSDELKDTYELYQDLLTCIKNKDIEKLNYILDNIKEDYPNISNYMKKSIKSIKVNKTFIINMMSSNYTNGVLEGINNKIKTIKRVAFGYRCFYHFKARILITQGMGKIQKGLSKCA